MKSQLIRNIQTLWSFCSAFFLLSRCSRDNSKPGGSSQKCTKNLTFSKLAWEIGKLNRDTFDSVKTISELISALLSSMTKESIYTDRLNHAAQCTTSRLRNVVSALCVGTYTLSLSRASAKMISFSSLKRRKTQTSLNLIHASLFPALISL